MYSFKEKLLLLVFTVLGLASLWFFISFKSDAFPEYTIDLKISRIQAAKLSEQTSRKLGINVQGYTKSTIFATDDTAKNFLEQNVGVQETAKLAQKEVVIWNYSTRFYKPLEKQEYNFSYSPTGEFVGFNSKISEDAQGENLTKDDAQKVAENFLLNQTNIYLSNYQIVSSEAEKKTNRTDHVFVWEQKDFSLNGATDRVEVAVFGGTVGSFNQFLKVPENWLRSYEQDRSYNNVAQVVAEAINYIFFGIAILVTFVIGFKTHQLNLNFSRNVALVIAVITFFASINYFPIILYYFPTTESFSAFTTQVILGAFSAAFFSGLIAFLTVAAGELIYRQQFKENLNLAKIFPLGVFTKNINLNLFVGTFAGFIFLAYVLIYYFVGQKFGFWVPAETNYSELFNTYIPWIYPLLVGLSAAVIEEAIFRLFGITFLNKYLKNTFVAVFITSVAWAFLHSSYPQSPWYARGIEISVVGFVLGWLFLRFGIIASISAHYTFNALQTAIFFVSSKDLYITSSSIFIALIPLLLAFAGLFYKFKNKNFATLINSSNLDFKIPTVVQKTISQVQSLPGYVPMTKKYVLSIVITAVCLSVIGIALSFKQEYVNIKDHATRKAVQEQSKEILKGNNININEFHSTILFSINSVDPLVEKYFLDNNGSKILKEIYLNQIPTETWNIRFFKPLTKDEYIVRFLADGSFYSLDYVIDENSKGANLNSQQALNIAQNCLKQKGLALQSVSLIDEQTEKRKNRTDHYFIFEQTDLKFKQASLRINVDILGDKVSGFEKFVKLPENFVRAETSTQFKDIVSQTAVSFFIGFVIIIFVINFLNQFRHQQLAFKKVLPFAGLTAFILVASFINQFPSFYVNYDTSIPLNNFQLQQGFIFILSIVFFVLLILLIFASFKNLWESMFAPILPTKNRLAYVKDAVFVSYLAQFILIPIALIIGYVLSELNLVTASNLSVDLGFATFLPVVQEISQLQMAIIAFVTLSSFTLVLFSYTKGWTKLLTILTLIIAISSTTGADNIKEYLTNFVPSLTFLLIAILLIIFIFRKNFLSLIGTIYVSVLLSSGMALLAEPAMFYRINGLILLALSFAPLLVLIIYRLRFKKQVV